MAFTSVLDAQVDVSASGLTTLVAAPVNGRIRLLAFFLCAGGAVSVSFVGATIAGPIIFTAAGESGHAPQTDIGILSTTVGGDLEIDLTAAVAVTGWINYVVV